MAPAIESQRSCAENPLTSSSSFGEWVESDDDNDSVSSVSNVVNTLRALARPLPGVLEPAAPKELHFTIDLGGPLSRKMNIFNADSELYLQGRVVDDPKGGGRHLSLVDPHGQEAASLWPCRKADVEFYTWRRPGGQAIAIVERRWHPRRGQCKQDLEVVIHGDSKSAIPFDVHCGYAGRGQFRVTSSAQRLLGSVARRRPVLSLGGTQLAVRVNAGVDRHAVLLMALLTVLSIRGPTVEYNSRRRTV